MAKVVKKKSVLYGGPTQYVMRQVTSDVCKVCKKQCARGIQYMEHMDKPGAVGEGVPCILTKTKVAR